MLPYPVYFHSATVTPSGCMYVFGGVKTLNSTEDVRSNDIFRMWLTQPTLAELCWEVVTACLQRNKALLSEARKLGIPHHFLQRVMWKPLFRDATVNSLIWTLRVIRLVVLKIFTDIKLLSFFFFITYATFKAIFRVKSLDSEDGFCIRLSKRQSPTTTFLHKTPIIQTIIFNQGMLLLGSNQFFTKVITTTNHKEQTARHEPIRIPSNIRVRINVGRVALVLAWSLP